MLCISQGLAFTLAFVMQHEHWSALIKRDTFDLCTLPFQANTAVFEACSKERIQPFDDDEEDIWEEKEINFATQTKSRNRSDGPQQIHMLSALCHWVISAFGTKLLGWKKC